MLLLKTGVCISLLVFFQLSCSERCSNMKFIFLAMETAGIAHEIKNEP